MNYLALFLIFFSGTASGRTLRFPYPKVMIATQEALTEMAFPIEEVKDGEITTRMIETPYEAMKGFIKETIPLRPDDKPGWKKARLRLTLKIKKMGEEKTKIEISGCIERFGVPSEFLLIPPAWTPATSNGLLEERILSGIEEKLSGPLKEKRKKSEELFSILPSDNSPKDPPFIPNVPVSNDPGTGNQNETTIGIFGGNYVCGGWNDNRTGVYHVEFAFSTDGGLTWSDDTLMIEPTYSEDGDPVICIDDSGTVYYFWLSFNRSPTMTGDIFLTKSRDGGRTWGPFINCTPNSPSSLDDKPWATMDGNNIFLTWYEYGTTYNLKFSRSTDRGQTWSTGLTVGSGGNGTFPFRGIDSTVYVGWGMQDVRLNISTDMGRTWQGQRTVIPVTWNPGSAPWRLNNIPSFGTSRDRTKLYCVFADSRLRSGQLDVFFSRSTDGGQTWMTPVKVNDTPAGDTTKQFYPWLAVDPYDRIHVVWHDTRAGGGRLAQYYSYSTDFGLTWSENYRVSDTAVVSSTFIGDYTACAADSNFVYALWCDARRGPANPDIFFSKGPIMRSDVGVTTILAPIGEIDSGTVVIPKAVVENLGTTTETFPVRFKIGNFYADDTVITLIAGGVDTAEFSPWTAVQIGTHITKCTTQLSGDMNPTNDFIYDSVIVQPLVGITDHYSIPILPKTFSLVNNYPNPFTSQTAILYALPSQCAVDLVVYNSSGRLVRRLKSGIEKTGFYRVLWDGKDTKGEEVTEGIYFCRLEAGRFLATKKMMKLK